MRTIGGITYLEVSELLTAGIAYDTVKKARQRGSKGWTVIDDPEDRRKVLVKYDDLKPTVKAVVDKVHGRAVADSRRVLWVSHLQAAAADLTVLRTHTLPDGSTLPEDAVASYAKACAYLRLFNTVTRKQVAAWGYSSTREWQADIIAHIQEEQVDLPNAYGRIMAKVRDYRTNGATAVISAKWGNQNSRKIGMDQSAWLVAQYAQPTKPDTAKVTARYAAEAKAKGWPSLCETAIYKHLMRSDIQPLWYIGRHGAAAYRNEFAHTLKLRGPAFRDALWCSDGTKLNYFYQGAGGMMAKLQVYLIMDVYSEAVLGYSVGHTEDFRAQFTAAKMALKASGHRPLQWLYDNQGGHKKRESQDFYSRASKLHFPAQPYNAKAKPIESLIGRMQQGVMRDRWFFTGQNITTKSLNSRPNLDFIEANRHRLPSMEEAMRCAGEDIQRWNNMPHPKTGMARIAMYEVSVNPQASPLDFIDMVELFWHTTQRQLTYRNDGITMDVGGQRLQYEVYGSDGMPSLDFIHRWTNAKFTAKYDPEDLSSLRLYKEDASGSLRYVAQAETKRSYARAVVDLQAGERGEIATLMALRKAQEELAKSDLELLRNQSGIDPDTLVEVGYRGNKDDMNLAESALQTGHTATPEDDDDEIDIYAAL